MKYFHYQLVKGGEWVKEPGYSLAHILGIYADRPYMWFTSPY